MVFKFDQSKFLFRAKAGVQEAMASPDLVLVQVVAAIDDMDKISNLVSERLTEWYGYHFPEFKQADAAKFAGVVLALDRANPDVAALVPVLGEQTANNVCDKAKKSVGVYLSEKDLHAVRAQAQALINLLNYREELVAYSDELATRLAPNISHIAGPSLAAKLIAQAGSLNKLASFPSSTVQVIGAEKALFKHLRSGSPPPKHGLIFQHPAISTAPRWTRGKLARALAAKITIASKADAYTHHFIAEKLKDQFEARVKALNGKPEPVKKPGYKPPVYPIRYGGRPQSSGGFNRPRPGGFNRPRNDGPRGPSRFNDDRPRHDEPRHDGPRNDRPGGFSPQGPRPGGDRPGGFSPGGPRPGNDRPGGNGPGPNREGGHRPGPREGGHRPGNDREGGHRPQNREGGNRFQKKRF